MATGGVKSSHRRQTSDYTAEDFIIDEDSGRWSLRDGRAEDRIAADIARRASAGDAVMAIAVGTKGDRRSYELGWYTAHR
jgi:hypothetical protein